MRCGYGGEYDCLSLLTRQHHAERWCLVVMAGEGSGAAGRGPPCALFTDVLVRKVGVVRLRRCHSSIIDAADVTMGDVGVGVLTDWPRPPP